jgi:hypothetical protein
MSENLRSDLMKLDVEEIGNTETWKRADTISDFVRDLDFSCERYPDGINLNGEKISDDRIRQYIWHHVQSEWFLWKKKKEMPTVESSKIKSCITAYISNPDLKCQEAVWIMLDSYVYQNLREYRTSIFLGDFTGQTDWVYCGNPNETLRTSWESIREELKHVSLVFSLRYLLLPIIAGILFYYHIFTLAKVVAGIFIIYLSWRILSFPWRFMERRSTKKINKEHEKILSKIEVVYSILSSQAINLDELTTAIHDARENQFALQGGELSALIAKAKEQFGPNLIPSKFIYSE